MSILDLERSAARESVRAVSFVLWWSPLGRHRKGPERRVRLRGRAVIALRDDNVTRRVARTFSIVENWPSPSSITAVESANGVPSATESQEESQPGQVLIVELPDQYQKLLGHRETGFGVRENGRADRQIGEELFDDPGKIAEFRLQDERSRRRMRGQDRGIVASDAAIYPVSPLDRGYTLGARR